MAITREANYAKKLGLPNFSSHQYCVIIRTELTHFSQVAEESARLYRVLQDAVDREIQEVGFMPDASTYGMHPSQNGNGGNDHPRNGSGRSSNGSGEHSNGHGSHGTRRAPSRPAMAGTARRGSGASSGGSSTNRSSKCRRLR
ncbi:MAG: hypothetical protein K8R23_06800 [Chthoniobacter sp.]|nr:hypothetical protein [Chthoniobacter sp.]